MWITVLQLPRRALYSTKAAPTIIKVLREPIIAVSPISGFPLIAAPIPGQKKCAFNRMGMSGSGRQHQPASCKFSVLQLTPTTGVYLSGNVGAGRVRLRRQSIMGLCMAWNASDGAGESQILYGNGLGTGPRLDFGRWDGSTKTIDVTLNGGNVGIGSTTPTASLDLSQKTDAVALPSGASSLRPTGVNGMIRYNSSLPGVEAYVNGAWTTLLSALSGTALSDLTGAIAINTIDNATYAQTWTWNTLTTQNALTAEFDVGDFGIALNVEQYEYVWRRSGV